MVSVPGSFSCPYYSLEELHIPFGLGKAVGSLCKVEESSRTEMCLGLPSTVVNIKTQIQLILICVKMKEMVTH